MSENSYLWDIVEEWIDSLPYPPSQAKMAEQLGVSKSTITDWKQGKSSPNVEDMRNLAALIAVPQQRLVQAMNKDQGYDPNDLPRMAR